jgi:hypothetical protein
MEEEEEPVMSKKEDAISPVKLELGNVDIAVILRALARYHDSFGSECTFDRTVVSMVMYSIEKQSGVTWVSLGGRN